MLMAFLNEIDFENRQGYDIEWECTDIQADCLFRNFKSSS